MNNKISKFNKIIYTVIFTALAMLVFMLNISIQDMNYYSELSSIQQFFIALNLSFNDFDIIYVALGLFIFNYFYKIYFNDVKFNKKSIINMIISFLLSVFILISKSYKINNTLETLHSTPAQVVKSLLLLIGYFLIIYAVLKHISNLKLVKNLEEKSKKKNPIWEKVKKVINNHPFILSFILILVLWLPYIIAYYPGASTGDTFDSLCQYFHRDNSWSIKTINLINENIYINKHHPVFFTVILGFIFDIGNHIKDFTLGALIYNILQITLSLIIFAFTIRYMKRVKVPLWIRVCFVLFLGLTPTVVGYAISAVKDTPSALFTLLYSIFLLQIIRNYNSIMNRKIRLIFFILTILLVILLRHNGIYTIFLSYPFLIFLYKKHWKKLVLTLVIPLIIFISYDKVLLPAFDITPGSIKEVLTVPFMQLARLDKHKSEEISKEDKETIMKILPNVNIGNLYNPDLADSVKDIYNKDATQKDLIKFYKVWFKYGIKHPIIYTESIINSTYGYFFPEIGENYAYLAVDNRIGKNSYFKVISKDEYKEVRDILHRIALTEAKAPILFLFNHVAFYDWFLIISCIYVMKKKKYKYLIPLAPSLAVLLVCLASPINGSFRYILPIVYSLPLIFTVDYLVYKEK